MQTRITKLFDIQHPIIQGGIHYVGFAELAAAVPSHVVANPTLARSYGSGRAAATPLDFPRALVESFRAAAVGLWGAPESNGFVSSTATGCRERASLTPRRSHARQRRRIV